MRGLLDPLPGASSLRLAEQTGAAPFSEVPAAALLCLVA